MTSTSDVLLRWRYRPVKKGIGPPKELVPVGSAWQKARKTLERVRLVVPRKSKVTKVFVCYVDCDLLEGKPKRGKVLIPCWAFVTSQREVVYVHGYAGHVLKPKESPVGDEDAKKLR